MLVIPAPTAASVIARSGVWSRLHNTAISREKAMYTMTVAKKPLAEGGRDRADHQTRQQDVL